jgi:hypothetical protein
MFILDLNTADRPTAQIHTSQVENCVFIAVRHKGNGQSGMPVRSYSYENNVRNYDNRKKISNYNGLPDS